MSKPRKLHASLSDTIHPFKNLFNTTSYAMVSSLVVCCCCCYEVEWCGVVNIVILHIYNFFKVGNTKFSKIHNALNIKWPAPCVTGGGRSALGTSPLLALHEELNSEN